MNELELLKSFKRRSQIIENIIREYLHIINADIKVDQFLIMSHLYDKDEVKQKQLMKDLGYKQSTLYHHLNNLSYRGYVTTMVDPLIKTNKLVRLTDKGIQFLIDHRKELDDMLNLSSGQLEEIEDSKEAMEVVT